MLEVRLKAAVEELGGTLREAERNRIHQELERSAKGKSSTLQTSSCLCKDYNG